MNPQTNPTHRRYDLDWLRVFAIISVFIYHSTRFFNLGDWHVKSPVLYTSVEIIQGFATSWMMPLIFLVSGASIFFALRKGGAGKFINDKLLRLGVPLLVCILTHASLQVYLEKTTHGLFTGSYFAFLPHYFEGIYLDIGSQGNFAIAGMHLWYLLVLLAYSVVFYPLFTWLTGRGAKVLAKLGDILAFPGVIYLLAPPTLIFLDFVENLPGGDTTPGGWPLLAYIPFLLAGFVLVSSSRLQARIQSWRWVSLGIGLVFSALYFYWATQPRYAQLLDDLDGPLYSIMSWGWILTFMGFASLRLSFTNPFLKYANEAVLPFYILHQTVLLVVGYFTFQWQISSLAQWLLIASTSFAIIMLAYEFLVRRTNVLRFLFGMKKISKTAVVTSREPLLAQKNIQ